MRTLSIARAALAALSMSILISACGGGGSQTPANDGTSSADLRPGVPAKLAFSVQPASAAAGAALATIVVDVQDGFGSLVSGATNAVTLAISGGATLNGTTTVNASGG